MSETPPLDARQLDARSRRDARRAREGRRVGAFFDMDKTIIAENSGSLFLRYLHEIGDISAWELARGVGAYMRYKLGLLDLQSWSRSAIGQFKGRIAEDVEQQTEEWAERNLTELIYPEARELIRSHQAEGHVVAIVSGATRYIVRPLARHLGVDDFLYTRLEIEDGTFTGRLIEPICFEEGKIYWLQHFIDEHDIDLARSYFYTDSITDLPLLELVGHPVVANPDPVLYRTAVKRRWPVRFFEAPGAGSIVGSSRKARPRTGRSGAASMDSDALREPGTRR